MADGFAAIFVGGERIYVPQANGDAVAQEVAIDEAAPGWGPLWTEGYGLAHSPSTLSNSGYRTGGVAANVLSPGYGSLCLVRCAPGTYNVEVRYKGGGASGTLVKERRLYVWTKEFPSSGV